MQVIDNQESAVLEGRFRRALCVFLQTILYRSEPQFSHATSSLSGFYLLLFFISPFFLNHPPSKSPGPGVLVSGSACREPTLYEDF